MLVYLPIVVRKTIVHGHGDVQVFFRAAWAIWTGYPLYEVTDNHGWTYHYPPTFALLLGPFANPLPGYPQPAWALPYAASIAIWYVFNALCAILSVHLWARALERYAPLQAEAFWQAWWMLRLAPLLALAPYIGASLERGQPSPLLLLLIVAFFVLYVGDRLVLASLSLAFAITIKVFPLFLLIIPFLRRDWPFMLFTAGWCALLLVALPIVCLGPATTLDLYRAMWTEHLSGIISGSMSARIASEVSPGAYASVSVGAALARIAAGAAFYAAPLPNWASAVQYLLDAALVASVALLGYGGFWNLRRLQPAKGYSLLVAGAVLFAAVPLMISVAKPNYVVFVLPLLALLVVEAWRRTGRQTLTRSMIGWTLIAWASIAALELPPMWNWIKIAGPMTLALLVLGPPSLALVRASVTAKVPGARRDSSM
jgi:hypothetical protein